jgi:lysophospholipase L1-like esterase
MKAFLRLRRPPRWKQRVLPFIAKSEARWRCFKRTIVVATTLVVSTILEVSPQGRYVVASLASEARRAARYSVGLPTPRSEIDEGWRRFRLLGIDGARRALESAFAQESPARQRLLKYAGLDPQHGVLRWGNFDRTLLLPSTVFEADDTGRSYRLRPLLRSVWLRNVTVVGAPLMFFLVPDGPGLQAAAEGTQAILVEGSQQTTNSWGLRGPEPDLDAPLRGIVLGDSFMQGLFLADDETPPECLRHRLETRLRSRVSILNTGHLGYSPEQYYFSLLAFLKRFRPHFVVVSVFVNDFGDTAEALLGNADWEESDYWLNQIAALCRRRGLTYLFVPVPLATQIQNRRASSFYPGMLSRELETNGLHYLNPIEAFVDAQLFLMNHRERDALEPHRCELFNDHISDGHFSALGSSLWGRRVADRLTELLERDRVISVGHPAADNRGVPR